MDVIEYFLNLDDESFNKVYEAHQQFGANYMAGVLAALKVVREREAKK